MNWRTSRNKLEKLRTPRKNTPSERLSPIRSYWLMILQPIWDCQGSSLRRKDISSSSSCTRRHGSTWKTNKMNMKLASTPIEAYLKDENIRSVLRRMNIVRTRQDWTLYIPTYKCEIYREGKREYRSYAFWHQKLQFLMEYFKWDYLQAIERMTDTPSFVCGKWGDITVTLLNN